jgi:hypothetical protein
VDDEHCRQFFLQPQQTFHRRYEALRAYFLEGQPLAEIAARFGYRLSSLKSVVCRFRASCVHGAAPPFFFQTDADAPPADDGVTNPTDPSSPRSPTPNV